MFNLNLIFFRFFLFLFFLINFFSVGFSSSVVVNNSETVFAGEIDFSRISVEAVGDIFIFNPTNSSEIFEFVFDFREDMILNVLVSDLNLVFDSSRVIGREVLPNSSINFSYRLSGVLSKNLYDSFEDFNGSLFDFYLDSSKFSPQKYASLSKHERENRNNTDSSRRKIGVEGTNPTEFDVNLDFMNLYKTTPDDLRFGDEDNLLTTFFKDNISAKGQFGFDFIDLNSDESSVYWIEFSVVSHYDFSSVRNLTFSPRSSGSGSGSDGSSEIGDEVLNISLNPLEISKISSTGIIEFGDDLRINLIILNPNDYLISDVKIFDSFPKFFELSDESGLENLVFDVGDIFPFETREISYDLSYELKSYDDVIYFPFARLDYENNGVSFSNSLNLINDLSKSSKKLFVEKKIKYNEDNSSAEVTIFVKNIGEDDLFDLQILDYGSGEFVLNKEWNIPRLDVGSVWDVSFEVDLISSEKDVLLPDVIGISDGNVYKTLVVDTSLESSAVDSKLSIATKILVSIGVILLVLDLLA